MSPKSARMFDGDLKALSTKMKATSSDSREAVLIINLLSTARHLIKPLMGPIIRDAPRYVPDPDDDEGESQSSSDEDEDPPRERRNLRTQWAGKLPGASKPAPVVRDKFGVAGRNIHDYEIVWDADPQSPCFDCNAAIGTHPHDRNAPLHNGYQPRIACDLTRVYCGKGG